MALDDNAALVLQTRTETKPEEEQPFRFLDLPKELRLMVYDYLVDREHHKISIVEDDESADITLVTPAPVPQIYLTCKELHAEAVPFLQKKVAKLGLSRTAPRIIVTGDSGWLVFTTIRLIVRTISTELDQPTEEKRLSEWNRYKHDKRLRALLEPFDTHRILAFCKMASKHFLKVNQYELSWYTEAYSTIAPLAPLWELPFEEWAKVVGLSGRLIAAPQAKYTALQVLVLGEELDEDEFVDLEDCMFDYIEDVARIRLYTLLRHRSELKQQSNTILAEWFYRSGELDEETWKNEWA